jgi:dnd system-associated protein 4
MQHEILKGALIMKDEDTLRLAIGPGDRNIYKDLRETGMPLAGMDNSRIFLLAMSIGFRHHARLELKSRDQFIQGSYLDAPQKSIIKAVAIFEEKDIKVLFDSKKVYTIAEEYAHGGIKILEELCNSRGTFSKKLVSELLEEIKENEKEILEEESISM